MKRYSAGLATGLLLAGIAAVVLGLMQEIRPERGEVPPVIYIGLGLTGLVIVLLIPHLVRVWRARRIVDERFSDRRRILAIVLIVIAAVTGILALAFVVWDAGGGMLSPALILMGAGCLLLAGAGALLLSRTSVERPGRAAALAAGTAIIGAAAVAALGFWIPSVPVHASTAAPDALDDSLMAELLPTEPAWTWEDAGRRVEASDVVAIPGGVAVRTVDGVVGLDGRTGEEVWHYRVDGARAWSIGGTPNGTWVMVTLGSGRYVDEYNGPAGVRLLALDGRTGEPGFDKVTDGGPPYGGVRLDLTDDALIGGGDGEVTAWSLADGKELWEWELPEGCFGATGAQDRAQTATRVLVATTCFDDAEADSSGGIARMYALDSKTGETVWTAEAEFEDAYPSTTRAEMEVAGDDSFAELRISTSFDDEPGAVIVDVETGEVVHDGALYLDGDSNRFGMLRLVDREFRLVPVLDDDEPGRAAVEPCSNATGYVSTERSFLTVYPSRGAGNGVCVGVAPWDDPDAAYSFDVDPATPVGELRGGGQAIVVLPGVTVLVDGESARVAGLR